MAGYQVVTPTAGSTAWTDFETQVQYARSGLLQLSLNPIADGTTAPRIAAGSKVGISGGLYYFASTETVTGTVTTTNTNYIMLTTSSSSITASFTSEVPSWNASKNGWYDATGNKRMIGIVTKDASSNYSEIGLLSRGASVWDKNGRELVAMQIETQNNLTGATLAPNTEVDVDITGFSWNPTAVLVAQVAFGLAADDLTGLACYGAGSAPRIYATSIGIELNIVSLTFGTNKVIMRLRNNMDASTMYYDNMVVTAVRAP